MEQSKAMQVMVQAEEAYGTVGEMEEYAVKLVNPNMLMKIGVYVKLRYERIGEEGVVLVDDEKFLFAIVQESGGGEGEGETVTRVFVVLSNPENPKVVGFVQINGCYYSYDGTTYDDPSEWEDVTPREVMVIQYQ